MPMRGSALSVGVGMLVLVRRGGVGDGGEVQADTAVRTNAKEHESKKWRPKVGVFCLALPLSSWKFRMFSACALRS